MKKEYNSYKADCSIKKLCRDICIATFILTGTFSFKGKASPGAKDLLHEATKLVRNSNHFTANLTQKLFQRPTKYSPQLVFA